MPCEPHGKGRLALLQSYRRNARTCQWCRGRRPPNEVGKLTQDTPAEERTCDVCGTVYETPALAAVCQAKPILPEINSGMSFTAGPSLRKIYVQGEEILPSRSFDCHPRRIHEFAVHYFGKARNIHEIEQIPIDTIEFMKRLQGSKNDPLKEMSATQLEFFCEDLFELGQEYKACRDSGMKILRLSLRFRVFRDIDRLYESGQLLGLFQLCEDLPSDFFWRISNSDYRGIDELIEMTRGSAS